MAIDLELTQIGHSPKALGRIRHLFSSLIPWTTKPASEMAARGQQKKQTLGQKVLGQLNQKSYVNEIFLSDVFFFFYPLVI